MSETARESGTKLNSNDIVNAEEILIKEMGERGYKKFSLEFVPLIMAALKIKK